MPAVKVTGNTEIVEQEDRELNPNSRNPVSVAVVESVVEDTKKKTGARGKRVVMGRSCRLLVLSPLHLLTIFGFLAAANAFSTDSKSHFSNVRSHLKQRKKVQGEREPRSFFSLSFL